MRDRAAASDVGEIDLHCHAARALVEARQDAVARTTVSTISS